LANGLKAPAFNPFNPAPYKVKTRFQAFACKCSWYLYSKARFNLRRALKIRATKAWRHAVAWRLKAHRTLSIAARRLYHRTAAASFTIWMDRVEELRGNRWGCTS
jgi:hypothetical protein